MVKIGTPNLNTEIKLVNDVNNFTDQQFNNEKIAIMM